jgi:hypothetical protein
MRWLVCAKKTKRIAPLIKNRLSLLKAERILFWLWWFAHFTIKLRIIKDYRTIIIAYASILSGIQQVGIELVMLLLRILQVLIYGCFNLTIKLKLIINAQHRWIVIEGLS